MRTWGTDRAGLWATAYRARGRGGVMVSLSGRGWLLSAALLGRGAGVGWWRRHGRMWDRDFRWSMPQEYRR